MSMNRQSPLVIKLLQVKDQNHCEYFENLEHKLLEESEKLTKVMTKPSLPVHSRKKNQLEASPNRKSITSIEPILEEELASPSSSDRIDTPKVEESSLKRARNLCEVMRKPKSPFEEKTKFPSHGFVKEHTQPEEKPADSLSTTKQKDPEKQKPAEHRVAKSQKIENLMRRVARLRSLKETISTESCKSSTNSVDENALPPHEKRERIRLSDFVIVKYLGEGKLGIVYLVRHKRTGFICALKRIQKSFFSNDEAVLTQRIREIKIQSFIDHPNIIQLYSVFVENNDLFLLMELCYSGSLYSLLKVEKRLGEERIRSIVKQVCHAVEYMHDNDILHRDIKPENIIFHENIAKICDFGWSVNSPLLRETRCGSPLYTSPEIAQKQQYDNKIDVWNIGVMVYELLFGKAPFQIRNEGDLSKVVEDEVYFPRSKPASPEIKSFICCCLDKNPKERYTIFKLIDHEFLAVCNSSVLHY